MDDLWVFVRQRFNKDVVIGGRLSETGKGTDGLKTCLIAGCTSKFSDASGLATGSHKPNQVVAEGEITKLRLSGIANTAHEFDMGAVTRLPGRIGELGEKFFVVNLGFIVRLERRSHAVVSACNHNDVAFGDRRSFVAGHVKGANK